MKKNQKTPEEPIRVLKRILEKNKDTHIGKQYEFSEIKSYRHYSESVPVHTFEMLRHYLDDQYLNGKPYLTIDKPIMYARTSGTTDKPKLIPVLNETINNYKRSQAVSTYSQYRECPAMYDGKILAITSQAIEGQTDNGIPYGSLSGLVYGNIPAVIKSKYVLPNGVFDIGGYDEKYLLICVFAVACRDITTIAAVNPSTILRILEIIKSRYCELIDVIDGVDSGFLKTISDGGRRLLKENIKVSRSRADELRSILPAGNSEICMKDIWPDLKAVITWTQGNCSVLIPKLEQQLDNGTKIFELGYYSSEFRGTVMLDAKSHSGVPVLNENFYEFISVDDWDKGINNFRVVDQLECGERYYIIVTTPYGLYRYFINDVIEVTGSFNSTPEIKFVRKGRGVTNITGEKLYEDQIVGVVNNLNDRPDINIGFFILLANPADMTYELLLESNDISDKDLCSIIDNELKKINLEYESKRNSGRLKPLMLSFLNSGTGEMYRKHCVLSGHRDSQFKFSHIMYSDECGFNFDKYIIN